MANKTAIVTGAARGIGLETTKILLERGYNVAMVDRDHDALQQACHGLGAAHPLTFDVSNPVHVHKIIHETEENFGRIDALVNNAGVAGFCSIEATTFETWRTVMATNLDGVFLCSQAAIPALKKTKGCIVNIASISASRASTLRVAYGTSKAGVVHLTRQQAVELGEYGIRVNCVAPGPVRTKLSAAVHSQEIIEAYHEAIPLNRYGSAKEIASVIAFLCSEDASYVTGQVIASDGGFEATGIGLKALRKHRENED